MKGYYNCKEKTCFFFSCALVLFKVLCYKMRRLGRAQPETGLSKKLTLHEPSRDQFIDS